MRAWPLEELRTWLSWSTTSRGHRGWQALCCMRILCVHKHMPLPCFCTWTAPHPASDHLSKGHLADSEELMPDLGSFANREVAVCLWQGGGAYRRLFKFLAMRFLLAPDQVLDCERVHARWIWLCDGTKGVRLPHMDATLRLTQHLETNGGRAPTARAHP